MFLHTGIKYRTREAGKPADSRTHKRGTVIEEVNVSKFCRRQEGGMSPMKVFSERTAITQELQDVRCNCCGNKVNKNEFNYFDDYISIEKSWGYHSPSDGETHCFDLCADCYFGWIKNFKIPVEVRG